MMFTLMYMLIDLDIAINNSNGVGYSRYTISLSFNLPWMLSLYNYSRKNMPYA